MAQEEGLEEGKLTTLVVEVEVVINVRIGVVVAVTTITEVTPVVRVPVYNVEVAAFVTITVVVENVVVDDAACIGPGAAAVGAGKLETKAKPAAKLNKNTKGKIRRDDLLNRTSSSEPSRRPPVMPQADQEWLHQSCLNQNKALSYP